MNKIVEIAEEINTLNCDIKAETVVANLIENGVGTDEFVVNPAGTKKRGFSKDIEKAEILGLGNNKDILAIHLNRDGFYDSLPEGIFHSQGDKPQKTSAEMSHESKKLRTEEKEARSFFLPFQNEIFLQGVSLELAERKLLKQFSETAFDQIFPEFWNLDPKRAGLNHKFTSRLVRTLHYAHHIAGNLPLTAKCLEFIIGEQVKIRMILSGEKIKTTDKYDVIENMALGTSRLGETFICGIPRSGIDDLIPKAEVKIGPLKNTPLDDFLSGGTALKFLGCFYNYFIPAGMDIETIVLVERVKQHFLLGDRSAELALGYNTAI
jgi:hypothetical protein